MLERARKLTKPIQMLTSSESDFAPFALSLLEWDAVDFFIEILRPLKEATL